MNRSRYIYIETTYKLQSERFKMQQIRKHFYRQKQFISVSCSFKNINKKHKKIVTVDHWKKRHRIKNNNKKQENKNASLKFHLAVRFMYIITLNDYMAIESYEDRGAIYGTTNKISRNRFSYDCISIAFSIFSGSLLCALITPSSIFLFFHFVCYILCSISHF